MKNLFYAHSDKKLFYIAGYLDNNLKSLNQAALEFSKVAKCNVEEVHTFTVQNSRHYKYMQVFYVITEKIAQGAFELGSDWTMWKWIGY